MYYVYMRININKKRVNPRFNQKAYGFRTSITQTGLPLLNQFLETIKYFFIHNVSLLLTTGGKGFEILGFPKWQ